MKASRKMKIETTLAVAFTIALSISIAYMNRPRQTDIQTQLEAASLNNRATSTYSSNVQQVIRENIEGKLRQGSFETVVNGLKQSASSFGGRIPYLYMIFEDDVWRGKLNCKIPTDNVTSFTFETRQLISEHGKVTHISITITETEVNQTDQQEETFSEVSISLEESVEGGSPIISQIGIVVPWLATSLVWIAQALIVGVPLCFAFLGIIVMIDRGIVPLWRKQLKGKLRKSAECPQ